MHDEHVREGDLDTVWATLRGLERRVRDIETGHSPRIAVIEAVIDGIKEEFRQVRVTMESMRAAMSDILPRFENLLHSHILEEERVQKKVLFLLALVLLAVAYPEIAPFLKGLIV